MLHYGGCAHSLRVPRKASETESSQKCGRSEPVRASGGNSRAARGIAFTAQQISVAARSAPRAGRVS